MKSWREKCERLLWQESLKKKNSDAKYISFCTQEGEDNIYHAVLGEWSVDKEKFYFGKIAKKKKEMAELILNFQLNSQVSQLIIRDIKELIKENSHSSSIEKIRSKSQTHSENLNAILPELIADFIEYFNGQRSVWLPAEIELLGKIAAMTIVCHTTDKSKPNKFNEGHSQSIEIAYNGQFYERVSSNLMVDIPEFDKKDEPKISYTKEGILASMRNCTEQEFEPPSYENAKANVAEFGRDHLKNLSTKTYSFALEINSMHVEFKPNTQQLYISCLLLDELPKNVDAVLRLYEALLEGAMLGGQMAGGGVGIAVKEERILFHASLNMINADSLKLKQFTPLFKETVEKWREKCRDLIRSDYKEHKEETKPSKPKLKIKREMPAYDALMLDNPWVSRNTRGAFTGVTELTTRSQGQMRKKTGDSLSLFAPTNQVIAHQGSQSVNAELTLLP